MINHLLLNILTLFNHKNRFPEYIPVIPSDFKSVSVTKIKLDRTSSLENTFSYLLCILKAKSVEVNHVFCVCSKSLKESFIG